MRDIVVVNHNYSCLLYSANTNKTHLQAVDDDDDVDDMDFAQLEANAQQQGGH